jgi:hypothetical protein
MNKIQHYLNGLRLLAFLVKHHIPKKIAKTLIIHYEKLVYPLIYKGITHVH